MSSSETSGPDGRRPLTRERALAAAVDLADAEGVDAVSMRQLATRLGVVPMALYRHVDSKEDLLNGMIDALIAEYEPPLTGAWRGRVRGRILSARRVLLAHPWARGVIETRTTRTPMVLGYMDSLAGMFMDGGLSAELTHLGMHALGHRIWGFSPEAFEEPDAIPVPADPLERSRAVEQARKLYPHIISIFEATGGRCDEQYEFEFTLDLVLDAIERLHASDGVGRLSR